MLDGLQLGLSLAFSFENIFFCLVGVALGTLIGVLPGIGPSATVAMLLPITLSLSPVTALIMLAGIYYGAQYGGSTTAILINLPGEASSAVTAIDGYQLARQGKAGLALATAAIGSFVAGTIATIVIAILAPPMTRMALSFSAADYAALMVLGLVCSVALAQGSLVKALGMVVVGLLFGTLGTDMETGAGRFTFGFLELADGLDFVAVSVGLFGLSEILRNLEDESARTPLTSRLSSIFPTLSELKQMAPPILRGTMIGSVLGVLPGGGAILSSFASYTVEKKIAKDPSRFGKGALEGVAGPESANNAGAQTSFIPMLTLGIPANPVMALMMGGMLIQGIIPGPQVATQRPDVFWGIIASMWVGNLLLLALNLPLNGLWVRLLRVPYHYLFPAIIAFSGVGLYSLANSPFNIVVAAAFGAFGYLLLRLRCEPAPLLLGFILSPLLEENFRRAMLISNGDYHVFVERPISAGLLIASVLIMAIVALPSVSKRRSKVFVE